MKGKVLGSKETMVTRRGSQAIFKKILDFIGLISKNKIQVTIELCILP